MNGPCEHCRRPNSYVEGTRWSECGAWLCDDCYEQDANSPPQDYLDDPDFPPIGDAHDRV